MANQSRSITTSGHVVRVCVADIRAGFLGHLEHQRGRLGGSLHLRGVGAARVGLRVLRDGGDLVPGGASTRTRVLNRQHDPGLGRNLRFTIRAVNKPSRVWRRPLPGPYPC